jgi:tetratricopeptide (TPR) repeat protein
VYHNTVTHSIPLPIQFSEEPKKMMVQGDVVVNSPNVVINKTVVVDNSIDAEKVMHLAETALHADNNAEAVDYADEVLKVDPSNSRAWWIKGTGTNRLLNRYEESLIYFQKAIDNAHSDDNAKVMSEVADSVKKNFGILLSHRCNEFYNNLNGAMAVKNDANMVRETVLPFLKKCQDESTDWLYDTAKKMTETASKAYDNKIWPEYSRDDEGHPGKYSWETYIDRASGVLNILEAAVDLSDGDSSQVTKCYKKMIDVQTAIVNSCSYKQEWVDPVRIGKTSSIPGHYQWVSDYHLTDEAAQHRRVKIEEYKLEIKGLDPSYVIETPPTVANNGKALGLGLFLGIGGAVLGQVFEPVYTLAYALSGFGWFLVVIALIVGAVRKSKQKRQNQAASEMAARNLKQAGNTTMPDNNSNGKE